MKTAIHFLVSAGFLLMLVAPLDARTFTYKNGRKFEAELVGMLGTQVTLRSNGRSSKISLDRFSTADQKFIRESIVTGNGPFRATAPPKEAIDAGYRLRTFASEFRADSVDVNNTKMSGFQWYPWSFYGKKTDLGKIRLNSDGSVTLLGDVTGPGGELCTAVPNRSKDRFVGTAFGGGAYFVATFKFDPNDVVARKFKGWPAWWSQSLEVSLRLDGGLWDGQAPGYFHGVEADFMEYDCGDEVMKKGKVNCYGACMHDWYGVYNVTCKGMCHGKGGPGYRENIRVVPADTDFNQYHRYGFLWVPATDEKKGYAKYFFDGKEIGSGWSWGKFTNQQPPPAPPWLYSVIDKHHLVLILGTGVGEPMTVKSVAVWQKSGDDNLRF